MSIGTISTGIKVTSGIFGQGFIQTLDGARFRITTPGEFLAYHSSTSKLRIQIRMIKRETSLALGCVAVQSNNDIIVAHAGTYGKVSITLNGILVNINAKLSFGSGKIFSYKRGSHGRFIISGPNGLDIVLFNRTKLLQFQLKLPHSMCVGVAGLFGSCSKRVECAQTCNSSSLTSAVNITAASSIDIKDFISRWKLRQNDTLFGPVLNQTGELTTYTVAQTCLYMEKTGIITPALHGIFTGKYLSIAFMVKIKTVINAGVVISYSRNSSFAVAIDKTLHILLDNNTLDTGIEVQANIWATIAIAYHRETGVLQIFYLKVGGIVQTRTLVIGFKWFPNGGNLGIGMRQVTKLGPVSLSTFVGWVDEIQLWDTRLDGVTVQANFERNVDGTTIGIAAVWKMNEGEGTVVSDAKEKYDIKFPSPGFKQPRWAPADYMLKTDLTAVVLSPDNTLKKNAVDICTRLINSPVMSSSCNALLKNASNYYYLSCIESIVSNKNTGIASHVLTSYASECKAAGNLTKLPMTSLCNEVPEKQLLDFFGDNCTQKCIFGTPSGQLCQCDTGYFGRNCSSECPGSADSPCNNRGVCDIYGFCHCDPNWRGDSKCSKCTPGWFGSDCSFTVGIKVNTTILRCTVTEAGVYSGFDSLQFSLKHTGKYVLFNTSTITVYVDHAVCSGSSKCVSALYVKEGNLQLKFSVGTSETLLPQIHLGSKLITVNEFATSLGSNIVVRKTSFTSYTIQFKNALTISATSQSLFFALSVQDTDRLCISSNGLCGSCRSTPNTLPARFKSIGSASFSYYALYCLYFQQSTLYSENVNIFTADEVTIDFLIKSCDSSVCGGPIVSYAVNETFFVSNYKTVKIHIGVDVYDTRISTEIDSWNQIFVTISKRKWKLDIFIVYSNKLIYYRPFLLRHYPFLNNGILAVGSWLPSLGGPQQTPPFRSFTGHVDEIRVWNIFMDYSDVVQNIFVNINKLIPGLSALWKLDEGKGSSVKDIISGLSLTLPKYPWGKPKWSISDAPLLKPVAKTGVSSSLGERTKAEKVCTSLILSGPLEKACARIGNNIKQHYFTECLESILATDKESASLTVVINYADYCQAILQLEDWPARVLCNRFPDVHFPRWIGTNCTVSCVHGRKASHDDNVCICDYGYWDATCNNACDGGFLHPCSGHGICDLSTGKCACDARWRGNEQCSTCTAGLSGKDCSVAVLSSQSATLYSGISTIALQGYLTLFNGVMFRLFSIGEYYLMYSFKHHIIVQGRFVTCYDESTCLNAIAIKFNSHTLVLHAPYSYITSGNLVVWLNGTLIDIYRTDLTIRKYGFSVRRISISTYVVSHPKLQLYVSAFGRFLSMQVKAQANACVDNIGLLGTCKVDLKALLNTKVSMPNCTKHTFVNVSTASHIDDPVRDLNSTTIKDIQRFAGQFKLDICDSYFIYKFEKYVEYREANSEFTLYFDATAFVVVNTTGLLSTSYTTIDFMIYVIEDGTIFSYGESTIFALNLMKRQLLIRINDRIYPTGLMIKHKQWNQINFQWNQLQRKITLFVFNMHGSIQTQELIIDSSTDIFMRGGILAFGQWQQSVNATYSKPNGTFIGMLDEIKIWSRSFSAALVRQTWKRKVRPDADSLIKLWQFNNGQGVAVLDKVSQTKSDLPDFPWKRPVWKFSSLELKPQLRQKTIQEIDRKTGPFRHAAKFCFEIIWSKPLFTSCGTLGNETAAFYYESCVQIVIETNNVLYGLQSIVSYSDYCQTVLNLTAWPATELCQRFNITQLPIWMAERCSLNCQFGISQENICVCSRGYWGPSCGNTCPGGAFRPCNNHGSCDSSTGDCTCEVNWKGSNDCSKCSVGWTGVDCNIALAHVLSSVSSHKYAFIAGGHLITLNGLVINIPFPGQFWLLIDHRHSLSIQVWQTPCFVHKLCLTAVAIKHETSTVVIRAPYSKYSRPVILLDKTALDVSATSVVVKGRQSTLSVQFTSSNELLLTRGTSLRIFMLFFDRHLTLRIQLSPSICRYTEGIFGNCNSTNTTKIASDGASRIALQLKHLWNVSMKVNLFEGLKDHHLIVTGAEHALVFNNTGMVSDPLCRAFSAENSDYTLELLVKSNSSSGIIFSYSKLSTFALWTSETLKISVGKTVLQTRIRLLLNSWNHISLVWRKDTTTLEIYVHNDMIKLQRRIFTLKTSPFVTCGLLTIGQWLPSQVIPEAPLTGTGVFIIDEIRIWRRYFNPVLIQQNFGMNVVGSHPGLTALWKLNEGDDFIVQNHVTKENFYMPSKSWQNPSWILSDAKVSLNVSTIFNSVVSNASAVIEVQDYCKSLFYTGALWNSCKQLPGMIDYFYLVCVQDVSLNNDRTFAVMSVVNFADNCQSMLNLSFWPAQSLCNNFPVLHFPRWIGPKCNIPCLFGHQRSENSSKCICIKGYWGRDCSSTCPGGIHNTCSGHGRCDQITGRCICDVNWSGNSNCSRCGENWIGSNCDSVTEPIIYFSQNSVHKAFVSSSGLISTFTGYTFMFKSHSEAAEIYLLKTSHLNIVLTVRYSLCTWLNAYIRNCITHFTMKYSNAHIVLRAAYIMKNIQSVPVPYLWLNNKVVMVDHVTHIDKHFTMIRIERNVYQLKGPDQFSIMINIRQSFGISLSIPSQWCNNSTGLLGSCADKKESIEMFYDRTNASWIVPADLSLINYKLALYNENYYTWSGLYSVVLRDTGMVSTRMFTLNSKVITLQIYLKTLEYGGTLIAYQKRDTFAISNEKFIKVYTKTKSFVTDLQTEIGEHCLIVCLTLVVFKFL